MSCSCASQAIISANSYAFSSPKLLFFSSKYKNKRNVNLFTVRASSDESDCNDEECAPDKEVMLLLFHQVSAFSFFTQIRLVLFLVFASINVRLHCNCLPILLFCNSKAWWLEYFSKICFCLAINILSTIHIFTCINLAASDSIIR